MSVLPFPSFLDDVKEKGLKRALFEGINEVVERATAGMNVQDLREALRGDAPSRKPNPRLQPHADGFWLHMRPSYFHKSVTGLYPEFRLGWLSTYFVFFETITGIFLMVWYTPSPEIAYSNMLNIMSNVPMGQFVRDLHRLGAEAMVLIVTLHMLRTFLTASYKKPREFTWFTGVVLAIATFFLSFSGYLLPWDQLSLWAVTIGASMVEAAPPEIVGTNLNLIFRGGPELGANGLLRFYLLHVLAVPALLFVFLGVHYYKVVVHGHSLPPNEENIGEDTAKRVPLDKRVYFIPDILTSEVMWLGITTLILIVLVTWFFHAPLENHADPQVTPLGTTAPWYFLWIQGALKLGDKVIWGIVFPTVVIVFLMLYPYLDVAKSRRWAHRRVSLTIAFAMASGFTVLSYMGLSEFGVVNSADIEILHEITKEPAHNHLGIIRPIPFDELTPGMYVTRQFLAEEGSEAAAVAAFNQEIGSGSLPLEGGVTFLSYLSSGQHLPVSSLNFTVLSEGTELYHVMEEFAHMVESEDKELYNGWGAVIITDWQEDLKRVDVIISWDEVVMERGFPVLDENGEPILVLDENGSPTRRINSDHIFLHRNAQYFEAPGA
ncbi:MAG: cytochrome bc complex cytochrome b subunit [Anaerolineae bacterium]|nr:cytochrome bc complex cytochrome b subunit [Anaerolineae bacterium]NUQ05749.1 cytochrome bc complex cytochrome b subunit [Anaerolineae bacterium]